MDSDFPAADPPVRACLQFYTGAGATVGSVVTGDGPVIMEDGEASVYVTGTAPATAATVEVRFELLRGTSATGTDTLFVDDLYVGMPAGDTWVASNVGELANASERAFSFKLNQPQTVAFTLPLNDPLGAEIVSATNSLTDVPVIKVYRENTLMMVAEVMTADLKGGMSDHSIAVVAVETMWARFAKRLIGKSSAGYSVTTATAKNKILFDLLTTLNTESNTGIDSQAIASAATTGTYDVQGSTVEVTAGNTAVKFTGGPWRYKPFLELIQELGLTYNGFDFWQSPLDPVTNAGLSGALEIEDVRGTTKEDAIFEFGVGKANVVEYGFLMTNEERITQAHCLPPGFPSGQVASASSTLGASRVRLREAVVANDLTDYTFRQQLAENHVFVREVPRRIFTFVPNVEDGDRTPRFGIDFNIGDFVTGRVMDQGTLTLAALVRVYGAEVQVDVNGQIKTTLTLVQEV
jgi:hypothetical protein